MARIKLYVNLMPPRHPTTPSTQSPQKPSNCEVRFAVTAGEHWEIGRLWNHVEVEHRKAYGMDRRARWVKLQGTEGEDLPRHERVGNLWDMGMHKDDRHVFVVRDAFERESSLAPDSTLLHTSSATSPDSYSQGARGRGALTERPPSIWDAEKLGLPSPKLPGHHSNGSHSKSRPGPLLTGQDHSEQADDDHRGSHPPTQAHSRLKIINLPTAVQDAQEAEAQLLRESQQSQGQGQGQGQSQSQRSLAPSPAPGVEQVATSQNVMSDVTVVGNSQVGPWTPPLLHHHGHFQPPESAQRPQPESVLDTQEPSMPVSAGPRTADLLNTDPVEDDNILGSGVTDSDLERAEASSVAHRVTPRTPSNQLHKLANSSVGASRTTNRRRLNGDTVPKTALRSARIPNRSSSKSEHWTKEEDARLIEGLQQGLQIDDILKQFDMLRTAGSARYRKSYLIRRYPDLNLMPANPSSAPNPTRQHWAEDEIAQLCKGMRQGYSIDECRAQYLPSRSLEAISHKMRLLEPSVFKASENDRTLPVDQVQIKGWTMREDFKLRRAHLNDVNEHDLCTDWFPTVENAALLRKWRHYRSRMAEEDSQLASPQAPASSQTGMQSSPSRPAFGRVRPARVNEGAWMETQPTPAASDLVPGQGPTESQHSLHRVRTVQCVAIPAKSPMRPLGLTKLGPSHQTKLSFKPRGGSDSNQSARSQCLPSSVPGKFALAESHQGVEKDPTPTYSDEGSMLAQEEQLTFPSPTYMTERSTSRHHRNAVRTASKIDQGDVKGRCIHESLVGMGAGVAERHSPEPVQTTDFPSKIWSSQHALDPSMEDVAAALGEDYAVGARKRKRVKEPRPDVYDFSAHARSSNFQAGEQISSSSSVKGNQIDQVRSLSKAKGSVDTGSNTRPPREAENHGSRRSSQIDPSPPSPPPSQKQHNEPPGGWIPEAYNYHLAMGTLDKPERKRWELSDEELIGEIKSQMDDPNDEAVLAAALEFEKDSIALDKAIYFDDDELEQAIRHKIRQRDRERKGKASVRTGDDGVEEIIRYDDASDSEMSIDSNGIFGSVGNDADEDDSDEDIQQDWFHPPGVVDREILELEDDDSEGDLPGNGHAVVQQNPSASPFLPDLREAQAEVASPPIRGESEAQRPETAFVATASPLMPKPIMQGDTMGAKPPSAPSRTSFTIDAKKKDTEDAPSNNSRRHKKRVHKKLKRASKPNGRSAEVECMGPPPIPKRHVPHNDDKEETSTLATPSSPGRSRRKRTKRSRHQRRSAARRQSKTERSLSIESGQNREASSPSCIWPHVPPAASQSVTQTAAPGPLTGSSDSHGPDTHPTKMTKPLTPRRRPFEAIWRELEHRQKLPAPKPRVERPPLPAEEAFARAFAYMGETSSSDRSTSSDD